VSEFRDEVIGFDGVTLDEWFVAQIADGRLLPYLFRSCLVGATVQVLFLCLSLW
jgi:hypothetical protein